MALDPISAAALKSAGGMAGKPLIAFLRTQYARRGAEFADISSLSGVEPELDEAITVLRGTAEGLPSSLVAKLKGVLSARPGTFSDPDARRFAEDERVAALIKSGAKRTLHDEDIAEERQEARKIHAEMFGEEGIFGETLIEDAIAFATVTLLAHLTPGERHTMDLLGTVRGEFHERFDQLSDQIAGLGATGHIEAAPLNSEVQAETLRLRQQRMLQLSDYPDRALRLGARVESGLHAADTEVRAEAFREIAVVLIRTGRGPDAELWIAKAETLGADVVPERARVATAAENWDEALRILRDRQDALSRSLLIETLARRDGDAAALAHYETDFSPADVTGHLLQSLAARMINAGRRQDALHLIEQASASQISENPVLLYFRARLRICQAVPSDVAERLLEHEGMVPRRDDLHNDAAGQGNLEQALADLRKLEPILPNLEAADFAVLVDMNITFLGLCVGSPAEREVARTQLIARMKEPAQAAKLTPLATLYDVEIDWAALKASLAQAEALGGYDDMQLRAAFALKMEEGDPAAIASFVHQYRERLEPYLSSGSAVAIEIEALAKSGRMDDAKALLEAEREALGEATHSFLVATLAELEGGDAVPMRLAQFEASQTTHDLVIVVEAMRRAKDPRLGEHLVDLWRRRRQLSDAQHALDVLIRAGEEARAEQFLEELGDEARADPMLRTHLAWARFRQGRLGEAEAELRALNASGVDDYNSRHLAVMLAIETGRWHELEPLVQQQVTASENRSAGELISFARIARTIGSPVTLDLLRAAVALEPESAGINLNAYTIATEAGLDRSGEVGGWLAKALANAGDSKLIQTKNFDEVIEIVKDNRAATDRLGNLVNAADVPLFMAMGQMGGTQSALVIRQMAFNEAQTDSRRRTVVPLFAGNRAPRTDLEPASVSFDPLALLVLDYLGLLETALEAFDVILPAGTLHSFFEDLGKAAHSQPSRVAQARQLKEKVASGVLSVERFPDEGEEDGPVDKEFAALFAAAEARDGYVIDTAPLHPPGRLEPEVDPAPYAARLLSPGGLVAALQSNGVISRARAAAAEPSIAGGGSAFPNEPALEPDKPLFLTGLAAQYLSDAGLLGTLKAHVGLIVVSERTIAIADAEIAQGDAAEPIRAGIERIRAVLAEAIANKSARVGPSRRLKDDEARSGDPRVDFSPVMSVLRDAAGIDAFVCDDRAMNKYVQVTDRAGQSLVFLTTADLLVILHRLGKIDDDALHAAREKLRLGGAGLMPVEPEELARAVRESNWKIGPNAELRSMRDSIHLPLARRVAQVPNERPWFRLVSLSIGYAIDNAWREVADDQDAERAASWLLDLLPDPVAWSAGDGSPDREAWIQDVARHSLWAMSAIFAMPEMRVERYRSWFGARVEQRFALIDPGALEAVARTLYDTLSDPMVSDDDEA